MRGEAASESVLIPLRAPNDIPPCIRQRPFGILAIGTGFGSHAAACR